MSARAVVKENRTHAGETARVLLRTLVESGQLTKPEIEGATVIYQTPEKWLRRGREQRIGVPVAVATPNDVFLLLGGNTIKKMTHDQIG